MANTDTTYRVVGLRAENILRLKAVSIRPKGNLLEITGKNRQGKSSILQALFWALTGKANVQRKPIRDGAETARVEVDLDGGRGVLCVTLKIDGTKDEETGKVVGYSTKLTITNDEGMEKKKPHEWLVSLVNDLSFDPFEFSRMKPREQYDILRGFVTGFDFDEAARASLKDKEERTVVNRDVARLQAQVVAIVVPDDLAEEPVDLSAILQEMEDAETHNAGIAERVARRADAERLVTTHRDHANDLLGQIADLRQRIVGLEGMAADSIDRAKAIEEKLESADPLPEPIVLADLRAKMEEARTTERLQQDRARRVALDAELKAAAARSAALTEAMKTRETAKQSAIAAAAMPIEGIGFGDGEILLNGVPFDQGSDEERLSASFAIAAATNPRLRMIRIRDGALFDDEAMERIHRLADEKDMLVVVETVDSGRPGAVVISDGLVADAGDHA